VLAYVSAIQDISLSPVLISGAGTSMPGPNAGNRNEFATNPPFPWPWLSNRLKGIVHPKMKFLGEISLQRQE